MNVQICGPALRGADREAASWFARDKWPGCYVFDPEADGCGERGRLRFLTCLADALVALPGWECDPDACLEVAVAKRAGIGIHETEGGVR